MTWTYMILICSPVCISALLTSYIRDEGQMSKVKEEADSLQLDLSKRACFTQST